MPELPEVETIRRGLNSRIVGRRIEQVYGLGGRLVRNNPGGIEQVSSALAGASILGVERRGKFMWWVLDGPADSFVVHLGMSGQVRTTTPDGDVPRPPARHEHLRLLLDNGELISFVDPRMFGQLTVSDLSRDASGRMVPTAVHHIAPDPLELESDEQVTVLARLLHGKDRSVKTMLLDQGLVSGIGNIYADEGLFLAGLHGERAGSKVPVKVLREVLDGCRVVMEQAVEVGGTSFDALYVDVEGNPGYFERQLHVYGREGAACRVCGTEIQRLTVQGRSHFFCPACQRRPRNPRKSRKQN